MNARRELTSRLEAFLNTVGLNEVYGVIANYEGHPKEITFAKAVTLDATIKVYGEKFIQLRWQTQIRALPQYGEKVFTSEADIKTFLKAAFVDYDFDLAEGVPVK